VIIPCNCLEDWKFGFETISVERPLLFQKIQLLLVLAETVYFLSDMRRDVQDIFRLTPHEKQVMMFSATLSKDIRPVCKKFMQDVITIPSAAA